MVSYKKKKPKAPRNRTRVWVVVFLIVLAFAAAWWLWSCLFPPSPRFKSLLIQRNDELQEISNGQTVHLHPTDRIKILRISTNICFNYGVRLVSSGFDVSALLYEERTFVMFFPNRETLDQYTFRVKVKRFNEDMGHVDVVVEPHVEDWLEEAGKTVDATKRIALLERALKLLPNERRIIDRLVVEYKSLKRWPEAVQLLEEVARGSAETDVLYELLEIYGAMSNTDGTISVLKRLLDGDPDDVDVRLELASVLEKSGRYEDAIREYEKLLRVLENENRLYVYKTLGYLYTKTNQFQKAISSYLQAVWMDDKDVNLYYNLASLYEKLGQKDEADFFLGKAIKLKTDDIDGRLKLAERLIRKGELKKAEGHLKEVLERKPDSKEALFLMVKILEEVGDKSALRGLYRKWLSLEPDNETILYNLGVMEYEAGRLSASLRYFKKFAGLRPKDAEAHTYLFEIYRKKKEDDLAFGEAKTLVGLRPNDTSYYYYMFEYLSSRREYKEMIEIMKEGLKKNPKDADLREYLILAYLKEGEEDLATHQIEEILKLKPRDVPNLLRLAKLKEKQGKYKEALKTYKRIIDISPGHREAAEAYLRLRMKGLES